MFIDQGVLCAAVTVFFPEVPRRQPEKRTEKNQFLRRGFITRSTHVRLQLKGDFFLILFRACVLQEFPQSHSQLCEVIKKKNIENLTEDSNAPLRRQT